MKLDNNQSWMSELRLLVDHLVQPCYQLSKTNWKKTGSRINILALKASEYIFLKYGARSKLLES